MKCFQLSSGAFVDEKKRKVKHMKYSRPEIRRVGNADAAIQSSCAKLWFLVFDFEQTLKFPPRLATLLAYEADE
jgi:hypothetical protein